MQGYGNERINLYKVRSFGMKFSDTFDFVKENWKLLLRMLTYFVLPISVLQAANLNSLTTSMVSDLNSGHMATMIFSWCTLAVFGSIASIAVYTIVYAMMRMYRTRPNRLAGLTMRELSPEFFWCLKRAFVCLALVVVFIVVFILLAALFISVHPAMFIFPFIGVVACAIPLALLMPIYMFEDDCTVTEAVSKTFRYGFRTWGGTFAILFVVNVLTGIVTSMASVPYYIMSMMSTMFTNNFDSTMTQIVESPVYIAVMYLFSTLNLYLAYLATAVIAVATAYQYGHAAEKLDGTGIDDEINRFDNYGAPQQRNGGGTNAQQFDEIDNFERL